MVVRVRTATPLPDVPARVVQAEGVRLERSDRCGEDMAVLAAAVDAFPDRSGAGGRAVREVRDPSEPRDVAFPGPGFRAAGTRRVLPLGLGRQFEAELPEHVLEHDARVDDGVVRFGVVTVRSRLE